MTCSMDSNMVCMQGNQRFIGEAAVSVVSVFAADQYRGQALIFCLLGAYAF